MLILNILAARQEATRQALGRGLPFAFHQEVDNSRTVGYCPLTYLPAVIQWGGEEGSILGVYAIVSDSLPPISRPQKEPKKLTPPAGKAG